MRRDVEIADAGAIGQRDRDRGLQAALPPTGFEEVRDGAGAERVALERAVDGGGEFLRAVVVEQGEQARGVDAERFAPRRPGARAAWRPRGRRGAGGRAHSTDWPGASRRRGPRYAPPAR